MPPKDLASEPVSNPPHLHPLNDTALKGPFLPAAKTEYTVIAFVSKQVPGVDGSQVLRTGVHLTQVNRAANPMAIFVMKMMNQTNILV